MTFDEKQRVKKLRYEKKRKRRKNSRPVKGRKTKKQLFREAQLEAEQVYREFEEAMRKLLGGTIGVIYARYSSRYQESIGSQVRAILEDAIKRKIYIPIENIVFDVAVRGSKRHRDGLSKAEAILKSKRASVLLVFKTNRLFRKAYRCLEFIDRAVKTWRVRLIFVKDYLDSNDPDFNGIKLQVLAMLDEHGSRVHVDNVIAKHLDLVSQNVITGTVTFGFGGVDIEGQFTKRGYHRRRWVIDEFEATYVRQIFDWFTMDGLSIAEIVRKLNADQDAPLPPRSSGTWTRLAVINVLTNERYLGIFKYGEKMNVDLPDADYIVRQKRDAPLSIFTVSELRIVKAKVWFEAQKLLDDHKSNGGRRKGCKGKPTGSEIIRGLFVCPKHDCRTWISGDSIFCPDCQKLDRDNRCLVSKLPTSLASEMLLDKLSDLIVEDEPFVSSSHEHYVNALRNRNQTSPAEAKKLRNRSAELGRKIQNLKMDKGVTELEKKETDEKIRELRAKRDSVLVELANVENVTSQPCDPPSLENTVSRVRELASNLLKSAKSRDPVILGRMRHLLQVLTGGEITLHQCGSTEPRKGWLRAEFDVCLGSFLGDNDTIGTDSISPTRHVVIEFKRPCPFQEEADQAYHLDTVERLHRKEIGARLGCSKSKVTKLLKYAYAQRGEAFVDGRNRRATLTPSVPPVYTRIQDRVMELYHQDWLLQAIADEVGVCKDTITKVVKTWHQLQGITVEDGRIRRKRLAVKNRPK